MTERLTVDASPSSAVAVCSCGWREITTTPGRAWAACAAHQRHAHPGEQAANHTPATMAKRHR